MAYGVLAVDTDFEPHQKMHSTKLNSESKRDSNHYEALDFYQCIHGGLQLNFTEEHDPSDKILIPINMNGIGFSIEGLVIPKDRLDELQAAILKKRVEIMK